MLKNYLLTTWRNLSRNKLFSGINLLGLAIGLACFLLIALYVLHDTGGAYADSIYSNVFPLPAVDGNPKTALTEPKSIVLTESFAKKYFNTTLVAGRTLEMRSGTGTVLYKIGAVIKDIPSNSHF